MTKPGTTRMKLRKWAANLKNDIGETTDVAAANPKVVEKLQALVRVMNDDLGIDIALAGRFDRSVHDLDNES